MSGRKIEQCGIPSNLQLRLDGLNDGLGVLLGRGLQGHGSRVSLRLERQMEGGRLTFPPRSPVMWVPLAMVSRAAFSMMAACSKRFMCLRVGSTWRQRESHVAQSVRTGKDEPEHHQATEEEGGGVGESLAGNVGGGSGGRSGSQRGPIFAAGRRQTDP